MILFCRINSDAVISKTFPLHFSYLIETINTFFTRYMVEVPVGTDDFGNNKTTWALDTVTCEDATEFSSQYVGEQIISHRVVTKEEALALCDKDNNLSYSNWDEELKMKNYFTTWEEINK